MSMNRENINSPEDHNVPNYYTDLALETAETLYRGLEVDEEEGVSVETEEDWDGEINVTTVRILNEKGSREMGKPMGSYITIESELMKINDVEAHEAIIKIMSKKIGELHKLKKDSTVLVIGLGNWNVTPDALGPEVVGKILVTRHIMDSLPPQIDESVRPVCALSPGVMGLTGIETAEIVKGLVEKVKPELVVAIDALAARRSSRINSTIQISDAGINPGAGMGNKRMSMNRETLGVPVIAIGVPTVVDAATLVNDTMDLMLSSMMENLGEEQTGGEFYHMLKNLESQEKYGLVKEVLDPYVGNMFVTPKEVDEVVGRLANIIANSLNIALHPGISREDINRYMC